MKAMIVAATVYLMVARVDAGVQPFERVSIIQLIARPELYDGKVVQLVGYGTFEHEGTAIYLHAQDYEYGVSRNSVWLSLGEKWKGSFGTQPRYVLVRGVFRAGDGGHKGLHSGDLSDIERLEDWAPLTGRTDANSKPPHALGCSR
ncbi:hypothetical protein [Archangium sp.]|uniref:hypothetical protein n=1 Tax=Archangium sp. TaxID=1872627 RepID=UPI00286BD6E2|nr:hypothetical protein [Archangium sp.]